MYKVVIGLEVHCELETHSKNFSSAQNIYSEIPNSHLSALDLGFPGTLPMPNKEAIKKALKTALALHCQTPNEIVFDRKNYFYPDLPKGYQITQMTKPMGKDGYLMIHVDGEDKKIDIHQLHLEEDTASLDHYGTYSLIDYNRAGIPLMEIVTEPCIYSSKEAVAYLEALRSIFLYCGVSEAKSDKGQMRCDVNISLMKDTDTQLGIRAEIKNINSFYNVKEAIEYEIKRQTEILDSGGTVVQETRRFDDHDMVTYSMRSKVDAIDYKYFLEPNIAPTKITEAFIQEIKSELPMLQYERIIKYMNEHELSRYDATILVKEKEVSDYYDEVIKEGADPKIASNWITSIILGYLNKNEVNIQSIFITPKMLTDLIKMVIDQVISIKQGKEVLYMALEEKKEPSVIVQDLGLKQIVDQGSIKQVVLEVLDEQVQAIDQYKMGRTNIVDFLVGQVMKKTRGQANPASTMVLLKEEIEKRIQESK